MDQPMIHALTGTSLGGNPLEMKALGERLGQNGAVGYNSYEVRGSEVYPTVSDDFDDFLPKFEIRGTEVYPTTFNDRDDYGLPMFEIRDGYAYPTSFNDHDDFGFEVAQEADADGDGSDDAHGSPTASSDATLGDLAALAAVGIGLFAGAKAYSHVKERRRRAGQATASYAQVPNPSTHTAPAGWYPTHVGPRYWDGTAWAEASDAGVFPGIPSGFGVPGAVAAPRKQALVTIAWVIALMTFGYMLPWAVAVTRRSANATKVGLVSFFLAWTVVGWIVALVMACTGRPRAMQVRYPA
ncbi:MAG: superinfection immunity protein [Nocardioidaceae bacterium]